MNAYISLAWLQDRLDQPGLANAIFIELQNDGQGASSAIGSKAQNLLHPKLADLGLEIEMTPLGYINITSKRMILEPGAEKEILKTLNGKLTQGLVVQTAFTYLANTIADQSSGGTRPREIPYSTITAIDFAGQAPLGPFLSSEGKALPAPEGRRNRPELLGSRGPRCQTGRSDLRNLF